MHRIDLGWFLGWVLVGLSGCLEVNPSPELGDAGWTSVEASAGPQAEETQEAGRTLPPAQLEPKDAGPDAAPRVDATLPEIRDARSTPGDAEEDAARVVDASTPLVDAASDSASAADATPTPNACAGKAGAKRGKSTQSVSVGGVRRSFVYYAPKQLDPNRPVPLVIVPHGYTQSGEAMFDITKYPQLADREGFVAIFPDGAPLSVGPWDVGSGVCGNGTFVPGSGDDQGFVDAMIAFASADQCIDREHIFMSGWSMGGYLSHHSGCLRDDIRAIGPHSAGTHDLGRCKGRPKPVIMFHFDPDGLISYDCGAKARDAWIARNGCQRDQPEVKQVQGGKCEYYRGCPATAQVAFCTFQIPSNHRGDFLAGHAWSGGNPHSYSIAETESAAELGWSFFKKYAW